MGSRKVGEKEREREREFMMQSMGCIAHTHQRETKGATGNSLRSPTNLGE
jgi:hypothetical protein